MTTRRGRRPGKNKYIKIEEVPETIYQSGNDTSNEILSQRDCGGSRKETTGSSGQSNEKPTDPLGPWYPDTSPSKAKSSGSSPKGSLPTTSRAQTKVSGVATARSKTSTAKTPTATVTTAYLSKKEPDSRKTAPGGLASGETEDPSGSGRKRYSKDTSPDPSKRVKTEPEKKGNVPDDETDSDDDAVEIKYRVKKEPYKRPEISQILEDLDTIARKLKEGYAKLPPTEDSTPLKPILQIVSDAWDPHYIPPELLELVNRPENDPNDPEGPTVLWESITDIRAGRVPTKPLYKYLYDDEELKEHERRQREYRRREAAFNREEYYAGAGGGYEVSGIDASELDPKDLEQMTLKHVSSQGDLIFPKAEPGDYMGLNYNQTIGGMSTESQESEMGVDPHPQNIDDDLDPNVSLENLKIDEPVPSTSMGACMAPMEEKAIALPSCMMDEDDEVVCPICGKNFQKSRIETHANHCATETFRD